MLVAWYCRDFLFPGGCFPYFPSSQLLIIMLSKKEKKISGSEKNMLKFCIYAWEATWTKRKVFDLFQYMCFNILTTQGVEAPPPPKKK